MLAKNHTLAARLLVTFAFVISMPAFDAQALDLSSSDAGTYVILNKDRLPTQMYYRLQRQNEKWVMYGKKPGAKWQNITCDSGCEYTKADDNEVSSYFPPVLREKMNIACIKNKAQAFCRYSPKDSPDKVAHIVIGLVTGAPAPIFIKRVSPGTVP